MWHLIAQETAPGSDPLEWLNYGAIGVLVVLILTGYLWAKPAVDQIRADNERLRKEREERDEVLLAEMRGLRTDIRNLTDEVRRLIAEVGRREYRG